MRAQNGQEPGEHDKERNEMLSGDQEIPEQNYSLGDGKIRRKWGGLVRTGVEGNMNNTTSGFTFTPRWVKKTNCYLS